MVKTIIYIDMDGVVADFDAATEQHALEGYLLTKGGKG